MVEEMLVKYLFCEYVLSIGSTPPVWNEDSHSLSENVLPVLCLWVPDFVGEIVELWLLFGWYERAHHMSKPWLGEFP